MCYLGAFAQRAGGISIRATIDRDRQQFFCPNASPRRGFYSNTHLLYFVNLFDWTGALATWVNTE